MCLPRDRKGDHAIGNVLVRHRFHKPMKHILARCRQPRQREQHVGALSRSGCRLSARWPSRRISIRDRAWSIGPSKRTTNSAWSPRMMVSAAGVEASARIGRAGAGAVDIRSSASIAQTTVRWDRNVLPPVRSPKPCVIGRNVFRRQSATGHAPNRKKVLNNFRYRAARPRFRIRDGREQSKHRDLTNIRFRERHQPRGTAGMGADPTGQHLAGSRQSGRCPSPSLRRV
jgi:hypothetical protein